MLPDWPLHNVLPGFQALTLNPSQCLRDLDALDALLAGMAELDERANTPPFSGQFPIFEAESGYPCELSCIVRDEDKAMGEGDRCDQQVVRTNRSAAAREIRPDVTVYVGCRVVEGE